MKVASEIKREKAYLVCPYVSLEDSKYRAKELELLSESALLEVVKINILDRKSVV